MIFPKEIIDIFVNDSQLIDLYVPCLRIYFGAYIFMGLQMMGQYMYVA